MTAPYLGFAAYYAGMFACASVLAWRGSPGYALALAIVCSLLGPEVRASR